MENRKIAIAWFTAASATYLDLGLNAGQRICLYGECLGVALETSDCRLCFLCTHALLSLMGNNTTVARMYEYLRLGTTHLMKEDYDDAIFYSEKSLAIAQESGDKVAEMNAYMGLGEAHLKKEEYDDAILYHEKCLAIAQESGLILVEMAAFKSLGTSHYKKEQYNDAILYSQKYLAIAQESGLKMAEINAKTTPGSVRTLGEINAYITLGAAHLKKDKYDDAILYSEKGLAIAEKFGEKVAETNAYIILGKAWFYKEEYDDAIFYSKKCIAIAQEFDVKMAMIAYMTLMEAQLKKEEYDDAIFYSEICLAIAQESGHKVTEMNAYLTLGKAHFFKKEYDDAIFYSEKSLAIAQEFGDKVTEMNAYLTLGKAHFFRKECDDTIFYSEKSLAIAQEFGDKVTEMNAYIMLGDANLHIEEYEDAILYSKKSLAIAQEYGDKVDEIRAYSTLGDVHLGSGKFDDAILYNKKRLAIALQFGDKVTQMNAYHRIGYTHLRKEEYDDAVLYSEKCLALALECGDKEAEMDAYSTLGYVDVNIQKFDDAYTYFRKGLSMGEDLEDESFITHFKIGLSVVYGEVGILDVPAFHLISSSYWETFGRKDLSFLNCWMTFVHHLAQHKYEKAISCLEEGMAALTQAFGHDIIFCLLFYKGMISDLHASLGQYDKAIQSHKETLHLALENGNKHYIAKCHFGLGIIHYDLGRIEKAEKSFKEFFKYSEFIFDRLGQNDRFKIAFIDQYKMAYKMLPKVLTKQNKKEEALLLSDHYRAKALKDLLVSSYGMKKEPFPKEGLQYADVQSLVSSSNYTLLSYSTCFEELYTFLVEAGNELEFSVQHFRYCDAYLDKLVDKTFDEMKVRQVVNCEERSSLDVLHDFEEKKNPKEDKSTKLLTRRREKWPSEQHRSLCGSRGGPSENNEESSLKSGMEILYHKLINNINFLIKQDEIVIIPEGPLYKVPFAALQDPDTGQYLSETKRIRMAPSITSLKLLQECPVDQHASAGALIIGAPLVGRVMMDGTEEDVDFLEGALDEAIEISFILGVRPLLAADATKPVVLEKLQQGVSVVHIAAHGSLSKATIVLAPSPEIRATKIPDEEDYMLTMADVYSAQVRAKLVVLSCCYSGRGQIKAEGVVGMCRAFLASGARAVVGSLWAIDDEATRKFMETFYTYLKDGKSASTSLHLTMNDMRRTPEYSEPKYWAPFFLMGGDVTIKLK